MSALVISMLSVLTFNTQWWFDKRIHNFGNIGFTGMIHANVANFATRMIDKVAYNNRDIRSEILDDIPANSIVCDFGCGVGISTFDSPLSYGVDTSDEMIKVAKRENTDTSATFVEGNAISYGDENQFSYCTIFYLLHEAPRYGRKAVLKNWVEASSFPNFDKNKTTVANMALTMFCSILCKCDGVFINPIN